MKHDPAKGREDLTWLAGRHLPALFAGIVPPLYFSYLLELGLIDHL
jgi:hypothetical protein